MEGPRPLTPDELPSLAKLVDSVFMPGQHGGMGRCFPALFNEGNCRNLLGFVDKGRVVAHLGMTKRWASLGGAIVRVACVGAVATYEEYRGKGLASALLQTACDSAVQDGVDFMLISGGLNLYRRVGAADYGRDWRVAVSRQTASRLALDGVTLMPMTPDEIPFCAAAYAAKTAHFIRPCDDWHWSLQCRSCATRDVELLVVCHNSVPCAYLICHMPKDDDDVLVMEHAGDRLAIGAAVAPLLRRYEAVAARFHIQSSEPGLRRLFESRGANLEQDVSPGTLLLLNVPQLIRRLQPYFETKVGLDAASKISADEDRGQFTFQLGREFALAESKGAAAELLFGNWDRPPLEDLLGKAFPVPSLWYGLNYV